MTPGHLQRFQLLPVGQQHGALFRQLQGFHKCKIWAWLILPRCNSLGVLVGV